MAYSRTLEELELAVRREADMVNSQFVKAEEVREYINQSWAELYDRMVMFDQEYLLRYVTISAAAASSEGDFDILNDGLTGLVRSVSWAAPSGAGYAVGDTIALTQPSTGANTAWATVETINGSGAVTSATVIVAGGGYKSDTLNSSTATLNMSAVTGTGVGGTTTAYVESDFYKCKGVWIGSTNATTEGWNPLRRFQWEQQNALRQADLYGGLAALPLYRLYTVFGREKVAIAPMISGTYRIWYYPAPQRMLLGSDRVDGRAGWDEWVVKDAAMKCLVKEESLEQAASMKVLRDDIFKRFQLHAAERDATQPERVRDVRLLSRRAFPWR